MANILAILEDDAGRIAATRECAEDILPGAEVVVFYSAGEMISWLGQHLGDVILISLDHDLPIKDVAGIAADFGTGRHVADFLATIPPTCPVIVHSSNDACATGMFFAVKDADGPVSRVYPFDDLAWIKSSWAALVRRYVDEGLIGRGLAR